MKVSYNKAEIRFLQESEACRVATCHDNIPHVAPVSYIFYNESVCFATDYETRKYANLKVNDRVAVVVDEYSSIGNKAVCIQGKAQIIEEGPLFKSIYSLFHSRFEWVRHDPWNEREAPFVQVQALTKASWGFD